MGLRPETIGPYRIESRLGAGGMGEVYRAWDERLERWVALKLIRAEAAGSDKARERFRREARAAASLTHPAIVQIYDILETADGDAIVMEIVEGEPLARRIGRGPLPPREALRLAGEIAEGLATAHAKGLIHRDLKPENVMVTEGGHAKILDFGLAKRLEGESPLTRDSVVVGTFRSMSPEQARGLPLDPRSDLFSLGVLLYESLSGRSPFEAATPLDTLTRICSLRQPPLREAVPQLPEALSQFVDSLLEKDPAARPQSAREVAACLGELAGSASTAAYDGERTWGAFPAQRPVSRPVTLPGPISLPSPPLPPSSAEAPRRRRWIAPLVVALLVAAALTAFLRRNDGGRERLYVAVTRPETTAGPEALDLIAAGLRSALLRSLLSLEGVSPLAPEQVDPVEGTPVQVARAVAADEVVTSRLRCDAGLCQVTLNRVQQGDGSLLWTRSFEVPLDRPHLLDEAVATYIKEGYAGRGARESLARQDVRPEDYPELLRLRRELERKEQGLSLDAILERAAALQRRSPRFLDLYILQADVLRQKFGAGRDPADLARGFELLQQARELAPADPRPLVSLFELALKGGRRDAAEEALAELERLEPGDPAVSVMRARLLELQGDRERALALMREAAGQRPSWSHLFRLADMEYRLGESGEARRHLEELLRRFPGYPSALSLLGQIELLNGDPERAVAIYSELVERSPQVTELSNLGTASMLLKRYPEAEERFRQAAALGPKNPFLLLNLADVLLLQGKQGEAEELYRRLIGLVEQDPAAANWQLLSARAQGLAHLGERRQAVDAVQRVLVLAQGNAQAAYEAALVYSLVGDRSSALVNAERALAQGVAPRWFSLPWFDPLRASPELRALLKQAAVKSAGRR